jgi:hypothetical protein
LREQLRQNEELRSMQESAYREREGSVAERITKRIKQITVNVNRCTM